MPSLFSIEHANRGMVARGVAIFSKAIALKNGEPLARALGFSVEDKVPRHGMKRFAIR